MPRCLVLGSGAGCESGHKAPPTASFFPSLAMRVLRPRLHIDPAKPIWAALTPQRVSISASLMALKSADALLMDS